MKATLTLDDDVAALLGEAVRDEGRGLQEVGNDLLRRTLRRLRGRAKESSQSAVEAKPSSSGPPHTRSFPSGRCRLPNVDSVGEVLAWAEGEGFR